MATTNTIFSTTLQTLRKNNNVTQEQLANHLGVSAQAVSKWENGSYPEGDLLPKIADFFGVSISYLYGQEKEVVSVEQEVLDTLSKIAEEANKNGDYHRHEEYFEKMLNLAWAFQIGAWKNNKKYYDRGIPEKGNRTASVITDDSGFSYFNLNKENEYYMLVKESGEGFSHLFNDKERLRAFFELLGKKGAIDILKVLLTLSWGECITTSSLASKIGLSVEETENLLNLLKGAGKIQKIANGAFREVTIINEDKKETGYQVDGTVVTSYISLLLIANTILNPPLGYQMQINTRDKSWLEIIK